MSSPSRPLPRLFIARHGETEWSLNGRHTGRTDIPLTSRGEQRVLDSADRFVGEGRLIDPKNICTVFVSPRQRAHRTYQLLFSKITTPPQHTLTEEVREWDYGDYEGLVTDEIQKINPSWDGWKDGYPGGESVADLQSRVDAVIAKVREYHKRYFEEGVNVRDVMIVAHGHFGRVLIARWVGFPLSYGTNFTMDAGSISVLSYNHGTLAEPSITALNISCDLL